LNGFPEKKQSLHEKKKLEEAEEEDDGDGPMWFDDPFGEYEDSFGDEVVPKMAAKKAKK